MTGHSATMPRPMPALAPGVSRMSSPAGLAQSGTEHGEQAALFAWANRAVWEGVDAANDMTRYTKPLRTSEPAIPALRWLHAIPNGGERSKAVAGIMKAEGVRPGVADVFWPVPIGTYHGLYIELKRRKSVPSDLSDKQLEFRLFAIQQGYAWCWAKGWEMARDRLVAYALNMWNPLYGEVM